MNHDRILLKSKEQTIWLQSMQLQNALSDTNSANTLLQEQKSINEHLQHEIEQLQNQLENVHANQSTELQAENERLKLQVQNDLNDAFEKQTQFDAEKQTFEDQKAEMQRQLEGSQRDNEMLKSKLQLLHQEMEEYRLKQIEQSNVKENTNNLKQINALQKQVEIVNINKQELTLNNQQLAAENQQLKEQLAQQQQQQQELVDQLEQTKRENAHMQSQLQGQVDENVQIQAQINFIKQELANELNIEPQQIRQFSYDLRQYIQELLDYQEKQTQVIQQVQQNKNTSDQEIDMKTQIAVISQTSNIVPQQNDLQLNTNASDQETDIQTNNVVSESQIPQQKENQLNKTLKEQQAKELQKAEVNKMLSFFNQEFSFMQFTSTDINQFYTITVCNQKLEAFNLNLNLLIHTIIQKHQCFDELSQYSLKILEACYLTSQLIEHKYISINQFWETITNNFKNSLELCQYQLKECIVSYYVMIPSDQLLQLGKEYKLFCQKVDQIFKLNIIKQKTNYQENMQPELVQNQAILQQTEIQQNETQIQEQPQYMEPNNMIDQEQPIVDHELSQSAFNLDPQNIIQPQNLIDQTKFQFSQVKAQDSIRDSPAPLKYSQPFRTPIKQKTQKENSSKDMSIVSIDSDTPVNDKLVTKTQMCSQKLHEPRCTTTDHCFDLALRTSLQKSFKKESPEMFDRFSKRQLIEYVENANVNDNFWRLVLSQCSQYFQDKQNSQNQLVSIKRYFLVEFSKWK
ncbi:Hypothetical_protein [Hexamita inflata]|uniref:Hypothetical_protein n=1 Tax=Hexamita inflata TaxID=28002 RepID=A0AA86RKD7_9EUKA|nr:Hypothetical protein HINF_LOCUS61177 [Hexamita inflata]